MVISHSEGTGPSSARSGTATSGLEANVSGVMGMSLSLSLSVPKDCSGDAATGGGPEMDHTSSRLSVDANASYDAAPPLMNVLSVPTHVAVAAAAIFSVGMVMKSVEIVAQSASGRSSQLSFRWPSAVSGRTCSVISASSGTRGDWSSATSDAVSSSMTWSGLEEGAPPGKKVSIARTALRSSGMVMRCAGSTVKMRAKSSLAATEMSSDFCSHGAPSRRKRRKPVSVLGDATCHGLRPVTTLQRMVPSAQTSEGAVAYGRFLWKMPRHSVGAVLVSTCSALRYRGAAD